MLLPHLKDRIHVRRPGSRIEWLLTERERLVAENRGFAKRLARIKMYAVQGRFNAVKAAAADIYV